MEGFERFRNVVMMLLLLLKKCLLGADYPAGLERFINNLLDLASLCC